MDRHALKFISKRTDIEIDTPTSNSNLAQPLKDNTNIRIIKINSEQVRSENTSSILKQHQASSIVKNNDRPLKCLETLAQKAGITFDEKYDFASPPHPGINSCNNILGSTSVSSITSTTQKNFVMEKSQSPAQQLTPSTVSLQFSPEQIQQLQQLQLQHGSTFAAIQVKQEFPTHTSTAHQLGSGTASAGEIKHTGILDHTQGQLQQMQMQLADASAGTSASSTTHQTPTSAGAAVAAMQQHSTAISAMPSMQLTTTGQVPADWSQGRTVQLMQPPTPINSGFIYHPQMIVPGNLIHSTGLGQQQIQVIAASKPFQGSTPQMITATAPNTKPMLGANAGFTSGTYAIPSSQSPQTLLFSPVNVISQSPQQQQNLLQNYAAVAANAQQQQQNAKVNTDAQKNLQQKVVQKVTTTTNTVQSASGAGGVTAVAQQQQQQSTQQCVQVSQSTMPTATQIISPLQSATGAPQQMQISAPFLQSVPFWTNGLQHLTQNSIIIRGTQPDGTHGMFIQQPASHQTIQAQQPSQISLQCNVTQTPTKTRGPMDTINPKQQNHQGQPHQAAVGTASSQLQAAQQRSSQILAQGGAQIRPASSVSTQTAQNQNIIKHKMRNKQQPVRPAMPTMKTENGQLQQKTQTVSAGTAGTLQQQITAAVAQQPTMHQVVAGNKMVVMSAGTPLTIQNGQTIQQTASTNHAEKQQHQIQLQQIQKQQQQQVLLQQQLLQQQIAQIQQQQQLQQQHQQLQQQSQTQQIHLQVTPQTFISQQQTQMQNQIIQQQQQQLQQQRDQQQHQQQNIIHQIVVQQSPQQQMAVPLSVSSSTPASIASSGAAALQQHVNFQTKSTHIPTTTSVVTITNQSGPLVTSTVGLNQTAQLQQQQNLVAATLAASQQQQLAPQIVPSTVTPQNTTQTLSQSNIRASPSQNPILAMTSMMNAAASAQLSHSHQTSNSSLCANTTSSPNSNIVSLPTTPLKNISEHNQQQKTTNSPSTSQHATDISRGIAVSTASSNCIESKEINSKVILETTIMASSPLQNAEPHTTTNSLAIPNTTANIALNGEISIDTTQAAVQQTSHQLDSTNTATIIPNTIQQSSLSPDQTNNEQEDTAISENCEKSNVIPSSIDENSFSNSKCVNNTTISTAPKTAGPIIAKDLPKAMIKPNVLTHVIDGFVIQEANEPFPTTRQRYTDKDSSDEPPKKKTALDETLASNVVPSDMIICEQCGKAEHKSKLKKKRYCSPACARQAKVSVNEQTNELIIDNDNDLQTSPKEVNTKSETITAINRPTKCDDKMQIDVSIGSSAMQSLNNSNNQASNITTSQNLIQSNDTSVSINGIDTPQMINWTVSDVCEFIKNLPGCTDYVDDFEQQEIDGQALLLLKENHLVNAMGMKLGPALKIVAAAAAANTATTATTAITSVAPEREAQ